MTKRSVRPSPLSSSAAVAPERAGERVASGAVRAPRKLEEILRALPQTDLEGLIARMGIRIDAAKRIDAPAQAARALAGLPEVRDASRLPAPSAELLHRVAEGGGALVVPALPAAVEPLVSRAILFVRQHPHGVELVLPLAFLVQLKSWENEDPRSLRALLAQAPFETASAIAAHYLGRPAVPPVALSLETAWESLSSTELLRAEVAKLSFAESRLLEAIEVVGGEVDTPELLDLEREPIRMRGAGGVSATRRGVGFALERRGMLVPVHPNRHVMPVEVARIVGEKRRGEHEACRSQIRSFVLSEDHAPHRARFSSDAAMFAVALALTVRESPAEVRAGVGTPRSLLVRLSQRFGRDAESVALVAALSRAIGLWDPTALLATTSPGALEIWELSRMLFLAWRRGGAWDEARPDQEVMRVSASSRDPSPIAPIRDMVLEAFQDLGEGGWIPWKALENYLAADERILGVTRLVRRWSERVGVEALAPIEIARRIALETLPALGIVDTGTEGESFADGGRALRLTSRGRALLASADHASNGGNARSEFLDTQVLRVTGTARVADVLNLHAFAEVSRFGDELDLMLTQAAISRALVAGLDGDNVRLRIEAVAPLPDTFSRMLAQASAVVGKAGLVRASAFLWVEDPEIRELLRTKKTTGELFVDPSPPLGLLVAADVDSERLIRRCRAVGVEIELDGAVLRTAQPAAGSAAGGGRRASASYRSVRAK